MNTPTSTQSMVALLRRLRLIFAIIFSVNLFISILLFYQLRERNSNRIYDQITEELDYQNTQLSYSRNFVGWTVVHEPVLAEFTADKTAGEYIPLLTDLRSRFLLSTDVTGRGIYYYLYSSATNELYNLSELTIPYETIRKVRIFLTQKIVDRQTQPSVYIWKHYMIGQTPFLYYMIDYKGNYLAVLVPMDLFINNLEKINLGKYGGIRLLSANGEIYYDDTVSIPFPARLFYRTFEFPDQWSVLPYRVAATADTISGSGIYLILYGLMISLSLGVCLLLVRYMRKIYNGVISPVENFYSDIKRLEDETDPDITDIRLHDQSLLELQKANEQLRRMVKRIENLKIRQYETELEWNQSQITFLQNQIKPHFYLNCLSTIDSMVQLEDYEAVQKMILFTSRYLRYQFQANQAYARLEDELSHIQAYLDIQAMRLTMPFEYHCNAAAEARAALIPPMLLITFIENTIKHAQSPLAPLIVTLTAEIINREENRMLQVEISDTGQGFPEELLRDMQDLRKYSEHAVSHIGIANSIRRLDILYGDHYELHFKNGEKGGAQILLLLPCNSMEESV